MFDLINVINILYVKDTDDRLQGVSKLDNIIPVSIYQKYKNERLYHAYSVTLT